MGKKINVRNLFISFVFLLCICPSGSYAAPIIIDHTSVNQFYNLSDATIDAVQSDIRWHYAHTSHGSQLTTGLRRLENEDSKYDVNIGWRNLPTTAGTFNIFDGQERDDYIGPDKYWSTSAGVSATQDVLDNNPTINVSGWSWCRQTNTYSDSQMQLYLDTMAALEADNPDVTFVYMTGNAQTSGAYGYRRYNNNEKIRDWVRNSSNRVLFDFADLDAWWFDSETQTWAQNTYTYEGNIVPIEHSAFSGNEQAGHTTYTSTEQKGRAVWVMMAEINEASEVPVPGVIWLFASGLLSLAGIKRIKS